VLSILPVGVSPSSTMEHGPGTIRMSSALEPTARGDRRLTSPRRRPNDPDRESCPVRTRHVPTRFTSDGENVSPPLRWSGVPEDATELRISLTDRDAPRGTFTHWLVTGVNRATSTVEEGAVPVGGTEGRNDFGDTGASPPRHGLRGRRAPPLAGYSPFYRRRGCVGQSSPPESLEQALVCGVNDDVAVRWVREGALRSRR
jgi:hypothetical protein